MSISLSSHHVTTLLEATQVWFAAESVESEGTISFLLDPSVFEALESLECRAWLLASAYYVVRSSREFASACNEYGAGERPLASVRKARNNVIDSLVDYCRAKEHARKPQREIMVDAYPSFGEAMAVMVRCGDWAGFVARNCLDREMPIVMMAPPV